MPSVRVVVHGGKPFRDVFEQWANNDGAQRAQRIASAMKAAAPVASGDYRDGIAVQRDEHPSRPSFHIGSSVDYAGVVEADTGNAIRALDSAG